MALNTLKCNHVMPLHFKGLISSMQPNLYIQPTSLKLWKPWSDGGQIDHLLSILPVWVSFINHL